MNNNRLLVAVGWVGSIFGLIGSLLLALHVPYSGYGFLAYLGSNFAWLYHGVKTRTWALVVMQVGFTATSLVGLRNWVF
ncbi:hypothetical protein QLH52_19950 [Methylomonas sp. OY6]|uniref:Uncharacterized protein n=1 Tax=Methylomonas defluvii TaxID=3045149 RepID=A0ABU4ULN8_9GAMM|nr:MULTISPECIES: hypothetical protein [unclassified Methylomonas]MDX8129584.1 hypothetical protein [Methylomonas sp. OY6]